MEFKRSQNKRTKPYQKIKSLKSSSKALKRQCDILWSKCIKERAGNKSEISCKTDNLQAHHIIGKSSYFLKYNLDNGICLTAGEHFYFAHHAGRMEAFREKVKLLRGSDIFKKLTMGKNMKGHINLITTKIYLTKKLEEFNAKINRNK